MICNAIHYHSEKRKDHDEYTEVLIDADVLQHYLYNPGFKVADKEVKRCDNILKELGIQ